MLFVNPDAKVNRTIPNIGLAYAASIFNTCVIDLNTLPEPRDRYLNEEADTLGISIQSRTMGEAKNISEAYGAKYPQSKIKSVSGIIDIQCCYPYLRLGETLQIDTPFGDGLPFPNYELFDSFPIFQKNWQDGIWKYAIMTSLGCPYSCVYCMARNRGWVPRSAKNAAEELAWAKEKWKIKSFKILDDCFNLKEDRVIEFCKLVKPLGLTWNCANGIRADRLTDASAKAMAESGCKQVGFGIESTDPEILRGIKKGESIGQIEEGIKIAKKYFKEVNGFFIIGLPGSNYETDLATLHWAKHQGINAHFSYYIPLAKQMEYDALFYGENAKPMGDAYDKKLQAKIYKMTEAMRPGAKKENIVKRLIKKIL